METDMTGRIPARAARIAAAMLATGAVLAATAGTASAETEVIYNNIPSTLPGNFASYGNEAYSMSEFGGLVEFGGTARKNPTVIVAMSSWACETGNWYEHTCKSELGNKFEWPVSFSVYEVGPGGAVGAKIAAGSKVFRMPYRPSASVKCTGEKAGEWFGQGRCWHGKAFKIALPLKLAKLPAKAIVSVSYNTTDHGPSPIGATACNSTSAGCFYDSLNVAIIEPSEPAPTVGTDPSSDVYVNATYSEMFCTSGAAGVFGPAGCPAFWEGAQTAMTVKASL
jgi:hypothetical protein